MKILLNPKLAQKKITVIEDSSSQEELEDNEDLNVKDMKGKKLIILEDKLAVTETKISEIFKEVRKKVILDHHQDDSNKQHSVISSLCAKKGRVAEPSTQCSVEVNEYSGVPVAMKKKLEEDEEIFKKLKIPWMPEEMHLVSEGKCIDSENENLHRNIK